jgi:hypothetical protein
MALHLLNIKHPSRQLTQLKEDLTVLFFYAWGPESQNYSAHPITNKIKNLNKSLKQNLDKNKEDQQKDNKDIQIPGPPSPVTVTLVPLPIQVLLVSYWS